MLHFCPKLIASFIDVRHAIFLPHVRKGGRLRDEGLRTSAWEAIKLIDINGSTEKSGFLTQAATLVELYFDAISFTKEAIFLTWCVTGV